MKPHISLFILFLVLSVISAKAQDQKKLDSLLNEYSNKKSNSLHAKTLSALHEEYRYSNPERAQKYLFELLALSEKMGDAELKSKAYFFVNINYYDQGNIDSSSLYIKKAMNEFKNYNNPEQKLLIKNAYGIIEQYKGNLDEALVIFDENIEFNKNTVQDSSILGSSLETKGLIYKQKGEYEKALEEILKAVKIFEKIKDPFGLAYNFHLLGDVESRMGNFEKAVEYQLKALPYFELNNIKMWESTVLMSLGNEEMNLKNFHKSKEYYQKSLAISEEIDDYYNQQVTHNNLGRIYLLLEQYGQALSHAKRSAKLLEVTKNELKILENKNLIGNIYHLSGQSKQAIPYYEQVIPVADSLGLKLLLSDSYFYKSDAYVGIKDYQQALNDYKKHSKIKDSIFNNEKSTQIEDMRAKYDTEKKEQQIVLQEKEIIVLQQEAAINNLQRMLMGIALLLSSIGFYAIRQKIKRNKLEKEKLDAELAFKKKELTTHALHLAKKNEVLEGLKQKAEELKISENGQNGYQQLIRTINFDLKDDTNWENFSRYFQEVHKDFNSNIKQKFPDVTSNELRLMSLLKMNLSSKEIANILNISQEGIKKARYRLRKKLSISTEDSLHDLILNL